MEPQKTKLNGRHQEILKQLRKKGFLATEQMARDFAVTMQTIHRDINMLSNRGLLHRYHGGAGAASSVENMAYASRQSLNHEASLTAVTSLVRSTNRMPQSLAILRVS